MRRLSVDSQVTIPIGLGSIAFFLITGGKILSPTYVDWLTRGDPATHFLGWHFFRNTPFFQWPLGANPGYGAEISSSIVYSDSLPLFAFLFKPFSALLPTPFQYSGIWVLLCFILQALLAWQLLARWTRDNGLKTLGTGFFVLAPPFLWRLQGHYTMMGQWLVLAALLLYLSAKSSHRRWLLLLAIAPLVHVYLLAMVLPIWLADLTKRLLLQEMTRTQAAVAFLSCTAGIVAVMWLGGFFMPGASIASETFGFYRMNLLSLIDPANHVGPSWSHFLKNQPEGLGDYEGFNFLGLGVLLLAVIAAAELIRTPLHGVRWRALLPLVIVSLLLTAFAFSNHVGLGEKRLLSYPLPAFFQPLANAFRASGRFFWPVYYLLLLSVLYVILTRFDRRPAIILLAGLLPLQIIDSSAVFSFFYKRHAEAPPWQSPLRSPFWSAAANKYRKIIYVLPSNIAENYFPLGYYAASHGMTINVAYLARLNETRRREVSERLSDSLVSGELDRDALYVFYHRGLWNVAQVALRKGDRAGIVDGFRVLAPDWADCSDCIKSTALNADPSTDGTSPGYEIGTLIQFNTTGKGQDYIAYGWSVPEPWGIWSESSSAALVIKLDKPVTSDLTLELSADGYITARRPTQEVEVSVNDGSIGTLYFTQAAPFGTMRLTIPQTAALANNDLLRVRFNIRNPVSPAELGLSSDPRRLGLGLRSLRLTPADASQGSNAP